MTEQQTAYCVRCRASQPLVDPTAIVMSNGRPALQSKCPTCGTKLTRIQSGKAPAQ